jgi:tRNA (guanine-N7-)-methyltransferase
LYQKILKSSGVIHLKTDSPDLYYFTKKVIAWHHLDLLEDCDDVYNKSDLSELKIKTHYEGLNIAKSGKIFYLKFSMTVILANQDESFKTFLKDEKETTGINSHS